MGNEFKAPFPDKKNTGNNLQSKSVVKQVICPLDGLPCEMDCPDRYRDRPEGGWQLTVAVELDRIEAQVQVKENAAQGATNTLGGQVEQHNNGRSTSSIQNP